jgi:predicted Zn-dependent peptidase
MPSAFRQASLPNGLTIIAEVDPAASTCAAGFFVRTGARDETSSLMGVSHFLEHMMFKGTQRMSADEINRAWDNMGARNNAYTSNELTCFYAHLLPERMDDGLDLLAHMLRPALRQSDFDTEKGVILEEIAMYADNPFWQVYEAVQEKHFGEHALSHRVLGTPDTITQMQRDDMLRYFEHRYSADNTTVALAGNLNFEACVDRIAQATHSWNATRPVRDAAPPRVGGGRFELRSEKVSRGYVLAMAQGPTVADDRRISASLIAQILGSPENSRLYWALIEPGIAEEAQASFEPHDGSGEFFVYASGEPTKIDQIWEAMHTQMRVLRDTLTQDDLDKLLPRFITGAALGNERPHDRMHRLGRMWTYLRDYWPLEEELRKVSAVTLRDLRGCLDAFAFSPMTVGVLKPK